jgi:hypothetical protein
MSLPRANDRCRSLLEIPHQNCSLCNNPMGIYTCHGCCRAFCVEHSVTHRNQLQAQLRDLRHRHNAMQTNVNNYNPQNDRRNLIEEINNWKQQSIQKIEQAAREALTNVMGMLSVNGQSQLDPLLECHTAFADRLQQAETTKDFRERHLDYWQQFLDDLQQNFNRFRTAHIGIEYCKMPFISKIIVRGSPSMFSFTNWCHYQRNCVQVTDIRRSGYFQQSNYTRSICMKPCKSFSAGNDCQVVEL